MTNGGYDPPANQDLERHGRHRRDARRQTTYTLLTTSQAFDILCYH